MRIFILFLMSFFLVVQNVSAQMFGSTEIEPLIFATPEAEQEYFAAQELSISWVSVKTKNSIALVFNQPIKTDSVRVTIENQTTKEVLKIAQYIPTQDTSSVEIVLENNLETSTSYRLTVNTATSLDEKTISAGVNAIKEFTSPSQFASDVVVAEPQVNIPATSTASTIQVKESTTSTENMASFTKTSTETPAKEPEVLPATGLEATIFFAIAAILAIFILGISHKRKS